MKWMRRNNALHFGKGDMQVMSQCRMQATEIIRHNRFNSGIPPLWSVLSYAMLQYDGGSVGIWRRYRLLTELARNPAAGYRRQWITKSNGELRPLSIPGPELRRQQKFILEWILKELEVDPHAFAYRKGVGIRECAQPHVNRDVVVHLDIEDFFGSITEDMIYQMLREQTGYEKSLCRFLARLCSVKGKLPQGAATSPMISNLVFRSCDQHLALMAARCGMDYSRYSDDMFFSGGEEARVDTLLRGAEMVLKLYGFRLNREKTKVRRRQHRQSVLGLTVNEGLQVNRAYRRRLMQELHYLERFGPGSRDAVAFGDYGGYLRSLQGKLGYVLQMDPDNPRLGAARQMLEGKIAAYERLGAR